MDLDILYQDDDVVVINKPSELLCVPGLRETQNLLDLARAQYPTIRTVHRLDMSTSGIIVYALNHHAQRHLGKQFEARCIKKHYTALVHGKVLATHGEISLPLLCDWPNRPRQKVDWANGKHAFTYFEVMHAKDDMSYLRLMPVTGRSHQLRVHCQSMGHPIVGDNLYAPASDNKRMMLHADYIQFFQPTSQQPITVHCRAPFINAHWYHQQT